MTKPLVSCIIPVFNGERYLAETVESVLSQTYEPTEIIIVDDGSTDGTDRVIDRYGKRVHAFRQDNAGTPSARNRGIIHAEGEYIAFLDADDLWHRQKLACQIESFADHPPLEMSFTFIQNFWSPEVPLEQRINDEYVMRSVPGYVCPTLLAKRHVFTRVGLFDTNLRHASEPTWILRAAEENICMTLVNQILVRRRLHSGSRSACNVGRVHDEYLHFLKASLDRRRAGGHLGYDFGAHSSHSSMPAGLLGVPR